MDQEKVDKIVDIIAKQFELQNDISRKFVEHALLAIQKFDEKNSEKQKNKFKFGAIEVLMKMDSKYETLVEHYNPDNDNSLQDEDLQKVWEDVAVYSLMGKIVDAGEWE